VPPADAVEATREATTCFGEIVLKIVDLIKIQKAVSNLFKPELARIDEI
jgi:hypothetical protein